MQPESSDGFGSVGTILPEERAALLPGGSFRFWGVLGAVRRFSRPMAWLGRSGLLRSSADHTAHIARNSWDRRLRERDPVRRIWGIWVAGSREFPSEHLRRSAAEWAARRRRAPD